MTKNIYLITYLIASSISVTAQFEGKITYKNSYEWKSENGLTNEQFTMFMGDEMEYFIKDEFYKSFSNGMYFNEQIYSPDQNRLYNIVNGSDTLIWINGSINSDTVVNYSIEKSDEIILGYKCKVFTIETTQGIAKYYFAKNFKIDPKPFKNHSYGNFSLVSSKTRSPSLRIVIENKNFNAVLEAVEIKELELDDSFFIIPDLPSKENPFY